MTKKRIIKVSIESLIEVLKNYAKEIENCKTEQCIINETESLIRLLSFYISELRKELYKNNI